MKDSPDLLLSLSNSHNKTHVQNFVSKQYSLYTQNQKFYTLFVFAK